jgi:hypothetical protein
LQIRPQAPHTLHVQECLENTSQRERDNSYVIELVTFVTSRFRDRDGPFCVTAGLDPAAHAAVGGRGWQVNAMSL